MNVNIVVDCPNCGPFDTGFAVAPGSSVKMQHSVATCPTCGHNTHIPDGVYENRPALGLVFTAE